MGCLGGGFDPRLTKLCLYKPDTHSLRLALYSIFHDFMHEAKFAWHGIFPHTVSCQCPNVWDFTVLN